MAGPEFPDIARKLAGAVSGAVRVYGVRRAGQHAVIGWILRNCGQAETVFLNNRRIGQSPFRPGKPAARDPGSTERAQALARRLSGRIARGQRPFLLISYEHGFSEAHYAAGDISPGLENSLFAHEVLVIRSFTNWLPSFIRLRQSQSPQLPANGLDMCQAILSGIAQYKAHLQAVVRTGHLAISFDSWVTSPSYRRQKLGALGFETLDNSIGAVQRFGGGSSFSGLETTPDPTALTRRWHRLAGDKFAAPFLRLVLDDPAFTEALFTIYPFEETRIRGLLAQM